MAEILEFIEKSDHASYQKWIGDNPYGFVLSSQERSITKTVVLHRSNCKKISVLPPNAKCWTNHPKFCSIDKDQLINFATKYKLSPCSYCHP